MSPKLILKAMLSLTALRRLTFLTYRCSRSTGMKL